MTYFYEFELVLLGIILLTAMTVGGARIWLKRKRESSEKVEFIENDEGKENL